MYGRVEVNYSGHGQLQTTATRAATVHAYPIMHHTHHPRLGQQFSSFHSTRSIVYRLPSLETCCAHSYVHRTASAASAKKEIITCRINEHLMWALKQFHKPYLPATCRSLIPSSLSHLHHPRHHRHLSTFNNNTTTYSTNATFPG